MKIYNYLGIPDEGIMSSLKKVSEFSDMAKMFLENDDEKHCLFCYEKTRIGDGNNSDFHPKKSGCIGMNDCYLFTIRCDTLVWIEGHTEEGDLGTIYFIGNHKGDLMMVAVGLYETPLELGDLSAFYNNETINQKD